MEKLKNYIIDVVPLVRLPLSHQQYFSYEFERKLPIGTLVEAPLFNKILNGIVISSRSDFHRPGNIKLKKVTNIIEENFLTSEQLTLAKFISDYYLCPLGTVLKAFVPKRIKTRIKNYELGIKNSKEIILTDNQTNAVNEITKNYSKFKIPARRQAWQNSKFLLFGPASSGKTEVYINAISKIKNQKSKCQFLLLLPELTLTPQAIERYGVIFKAEEIAVIHSKVSKGQLYDYWQKIKSGEIKLIIGTRMAVFMPFSSLKLIVIDEEQDISFKQWDMNPRYDARTVAEKLSEIYKAEIVRGSATPSVESYYKAQNNEYKLLTLPRLQIAGCKLQDPNIEIVDMRKERWTKNYSPISKKLQLEIEYVLKNKQQAILFINRQGMSNFSVCENCKSVLRCPKCDRSLVYDNSGIYQCLHCAYKTSILNTCPKCKGVIFRNIGLGTQKVEKEVQKIFPRARIKRVDFSTMKKKGSIEKLYKEFTGGNFDILIGTQMITKGWDNSRLSLVAIIDADNLLSLPDYNSQEKAFQLIMQTAGRTGRPGSKIPGKVIIQTYNPENALFKALKDRNYIAFYKNEIEERKLFFYPPYSQIIKLIFQHKNKQKVEKEAKKLYDNLRIKTANFQDIKIIQPQDPVINKIRGRYRRQIIIKLNKNKSADFKKNLNSLSSDWTIDVDPISLI